MSAASLRRTRQSRGLALIAVLWIVAALGVMTTGLLRSVKAEVQVASRQKQALVQGALADGAIRLALQEVLASKQPLDKPVAMPVQIEGQPVQVELWPLNGLIDINAAPELLLASLFQFAGGADAERALFLARQVIEVRSRRDPQGRPEGFDAPEDLLRVPGLDYPLYARIAPLVSASLAGSARVNPQAASPAMLAVLAQGNTALAAQLATVRDTSPQAMDTTQLTASFIDASPARALQAVARVASADGSATLSHWVVSLSASARTGLPWQVLETSRSHRPAPGGGR